MKYCVDCKHIVELRNKFAYCNHPELLHPVGKTPLECFMVRGGKDAHANNVFDYSACGYEAKYFESKENK